MNTWCSCKLEFTGPAENYSAGLHICELIDNSEYMALESILSAEERKYYATLKFEKRIKSFLLGRYSAKKAISINCEVEDLANIEVSNGYFNHPCVKPCCGQNVQVSITHCDNIGGAVAYTEAFPMGLDIEKIDVHTVEVIKTQITTNEMGIINTGSIDFNILYTIIWTSKEALSKVLRTGFMVGAHILEIEKLEFWGSFYLVEFKNFKQYHSVSYVFKEHVCSIVLADRYMPNINGSLILEQI